MVGDELRDALPDVVTYLSDARERLTAGIGQGPVLPECAGEKWTRVAAAHGDQPRGVCRQLRREQARHRGAQVDSGLSHGGDDLGVDALAWRRPCRKRSRFPRVGERIKE